MYQLSDAEMKSSSSSFGASHSRFGKNQIHCNQLPISVVSSSTNSNGIGNASSSNLPSGLASIPKKPMRPLTAYHIFFQIEREYVIQTTAGEDADKSIHKNKVILDDVPARYRSIKLLPDWYAGPGKRQKRKHRKQHGKIGFLELSRVISTRWAKLDEIDPETKAFVTKIAQQELDEYYKEMKEYKELTKDIMPAVEDAASAAPKSKKQSNKAKRRNSVTKQMISPAFQQMASSIGAMNSMASQSYPSSQQQSRPDAVSSFEPLDFISPGSLQFKSDIHYFLSRIENDTQHLLPRPSMNRVNNNTNNNINNTATDAHHQAQPQKKRKTFHRQDSGLCVSRFDPILEVNKFVDNSQINTQYNDGRPTVQRAVSNISIGSSSQCPSPSTEEVDICDDEILQLWKASNNNNGGVSM
jgi:hypothetical protein